MAEKLEDLRKVKDQASKALEKGKHRQAAELFVEIAAREPAPDWHQRAGDAFRRAGDAAQAVAAFARAADGYAQGGFLLKAIAVAKTILQIDPKQVEIQAKLAELYARRDGRPAASPSLSPSPSPSPSPSLSPPPSLSPSPPPSPLPTLDTVSSESILELFTPPSPRAPMDALPLRKVLGGQRSNLVPVAEITTPDALLDTVSPPDDFRVAPSPGFVAAAPIALSPELTEVEHAERQAPREPPAAYEIALSEEMDFSGLTDDEPAGGAPSASAAPAAAAAPPPLPRIPLFSSLAEHDLRLFIERMALHALEGGEAVVRAGDRGGSLYVLVEGEARVLIGAEELARLGPGSFFGEVGLLTDEPRGATVEVVGPASVLEISRELCWEVIGRSPEVLRTLLGFLRDRLLDRLLATSALFSSLSPDEARGLAGQFVFLELEAGVTAVKQGERAAGMFFLLCGQAEAIRDGQRLATLGPGEVFGEMSLLARAPATADVRAARKCWALQLPKARFQEIMVTYPQVLAYVSELADARRAPPTASVDFI
jgi:CRP-like cAMP-binding protein